MQFLVEGIKKAGSLDSDKVAKALLDLAIDTPIGKHTLRASDHQADRGQFYGKMVKGPNGNAIMTEVKYIDPRPFMLALARSQLCAARPPCGSLLRTS